MGQKQGYVAELDFSPRIMITMTNLTLPNPPLERLVGLCMPGSGPAGPGWKREDFDGWSETG